MRIALAVLCAALLSTAPALAQTTDNGAPTIAPGATANAMVSPAPGTTNGQASTGTTNSNPSGTSPNGMNAAPYGHRRRGWSGWWGLIGLIGLFGLFGRGGNSRTTVR